jgi:hypothetical protein
MTLKSPSQQKDSKLQNEIADVITFSKRRV